LKHAIDARHHVAGREADHMKAIFIQPCSAMQIMRHLSGLCVLIAVNFKDQSNRQAAEISEIGSERKLSAKAMSVHWFAPETFPQHLFCGRSLCAQFARALRWIGGPPPPSNRLLRI